MGDAQSMPQSILTPNELADNLEYTSFLFWQTLAELETEEIESILLGAQLNMPGRTAKVMTADMAFCDDRLLRRLQATIAGTPLETQPPRLQIDQDARILEVAKKPWLEVEQGAKDARQRLVEFTRKLSEEQLTLLTSASSISSSGSVSGSTSVTAVQELQDRADSVRIQRHKVQSYCGSLERWGRAGLRKLMVEQHENFMEGMAGLTEATMISVQVCGTWSIRDVYVHVLGWNEYCSRLLRHWPEPNPEMIREWEWQAEDTMATFNDRMMAARQEMTMIEIADGLTTEFRRIMRVFDKTSDANLCSEGLTWGGPGVMSNFFYEIFVHEAEHAAQIWAFRAGVSKEEATQNRSDDS